MTATNPKNAMGFIDSMVDDPEASYGVESHLHVKQGLPWEAAERIKEMLDLDDEELGRIIGIEKRSIGRRRKGEVKDSSLKEDEADRLLRTVHLFGLAVSVFESKQTARQWLKQDQPGLGMESPLDFLRSDGGAREVENLLGRIEHGMAL